MPGPGYIEADEALTKEELAAIEGSPKGIQVILLEKNMEAAKVAPTLPEPPLDEKQDKIDQMLEASGAKPTLLGS